MQKYEVLYVIKPDMEEEARTALIQKFSDLVTDNGGVVVNIDEWGTRKLAYPIDYITEGYYVLMNFDSAPDFPSELERNFRISEFVMRYMVIKRIENKKEAE